MRDFWTFILGRWRCYNIEKKREKTKKKHTASRCVFVNGWCRSGWHIGIRYLCTHTQVTEQNNLTMTFFSPIQNVTRLLLSSDTFRRIYRKWRIHSTRSRGMVAGWCWISFLFLFYFFSKNDAHLNLLMVSFILYSGIFAWRLKIERLQKWTK